MPLAATLATERVFEAFRSPSKVDALLHGHSYSGYPIGCAAAVEALGLMSSPQNPALCTPERFAHFVPHGCMTALSCTLQKLALQHCCRNVMFALAHHHRKNVIGRRVRLSRGDRATMHGASAKTVALSVGHTSSLPESSQFPLFRCTKEPACSQPCGRLLELWDIDQVSRLSQHPRIDRVIALGEPDAV